MTPPEPSVVVVGGYGHVGLRLVRLLAPHHPVVIAGRRPDEARRAAADAGVTSAAGAVDAATGDGLADAARPGDLVVAAAGDHPDVALLRRCIELGCHYTDLTADRRTIAAMLTLDVAARNAGVSALAGIGLAPGATNLLAATVAERLPGAERIDVGLMLSSADSFGPAALDWTLATFAAPEPDDVVPFSERARIDFGPAGTRWAWAFGFPEQFFLPASLGVPEVRGWFLLAPGAVSRALALALKPGPVRRTVARERFRRFYTRAAGLLPEHGPGGVVAASATARLGERTATATLSGRSESGTTAACAATIIDAWDRSVPGVRLPEAALAARSTLERLAAHGITVDLP